MDIEVTKDRIFESKKVATIDYRLEDACLKIEGYTSLTKKKCTRIIKQFEDNLLVLREIESELED